MEFWNRYLDSTGDPADPHYTDVTCFGDSVELADELLKLILNGPKRATACSLAELQAESLAAPTAGDRWIACDGTGTPRIVIRTTWVRVGPLSSVDEAFAWDEGEGDRTRADWQRSHNAYFRRRCDELGIAFHAQIPVVFERFEPAYSEPAGARSGTPISLPIGGSAGDESAMK